MTLSRLAQQPIAAHEGITLLGTIQAIGGIVALLLIAYLCSSNRKAINWKTVGFGLLLQFVLALSILKLSWVQSIFNAVGKIFVSILDFTAAGSVFLFGDLMNADTYGFIFVFQILPTIIFFAALTSLLFYLGVLQFLVKILAKGTAKLLNISGAESLSVIGNIFLGQTEAPLLIKAYLPKMNRSEMLLVMVGGMATVAGGVLAAYIGFLGGDDPVLRLAFAKHLLAASVMAAPGAIVVAKMLFPQTESIDKNTKVSTQEVGSNMLDAIANGTLQGVKLAANIGGMLLVFVALIAMANGILFEFGELTNLNGWVANWSSYDALSIEAILGTLFAPIMWLIGVPWDDLLPMGQLLGIKLAASEFVGYIQLAELKNVANEIHFSSQKSIVMATYMLCGFANFASIGIQIGGIGGLAPNQRKVLSKFGFRAVLGGTIASLLSATLVGALLG
ncbi:MAG: nucleoside transporter C-terminal domain-containing protein [Flavobacteriaceae bacterium]|jgi:CNT family concentrative nucleoside transporter|nr:nucleoside transporter C-terminal domain-containing protein [Flavobacteriaceae bacterium]MDG2289971.1 nucleoside transporter C-terminal domain-containing protein [Flavobacteriaceae bacterium]